MAYDGGVGRNHHNGVLCVSGCSNGCAAPGLATLMRPTHDGVAAVFAVALSQEVEQVVHESEGHWFDPQLCQSDTNDTKPQVAPNGCYIGALLNMCIDKHRNTGGKEPISSV